MFKRYKVTISGIIPGEGYFYAGAALSGVVAFDSGDTYSIHYHYGQHEMFYHDIINADGAETINLGGEPSAATNGQLIVELVSKVVHGEVTVTEI